MTRRVGLRCAVAALVTALVGASPARAQEAAFVPPPRTISDVLEKLDAELDMRRPGALAALAAETATPPVGPAPLPRPFVPAAERPTAQPRPMAPPPQVGGALSTLTDAQIADVTRRANEARAHANRLRNEGRIDEHLVAIREALDLARQVRHRDLTWFLSNAASAEFSFGSRQRSIALWLEAVDSTTNPNIAQAHAMDAIQRLTDERRLDEARAMLQRAEGFRLQAMMQFRDASSWEPAYDFRIEAGRGFIARASGDLPGAEAAFRRAVRFAETMHARVQSGLGNDRNWFANPLAFMLSQLSNALTQQQRFVEAEIYARRALQLWIEVAGTYHVSTVFRINGLVEVLIEQGRFAEAEKLALRSLAIQREMGIGLASIDTLSSRQQLASALLWQGKYAEALAQYRYMLRVIGQNQNLAENRVSTQRNYAFALLMTGDAAAAINVLNYIGARRADRARTGTHGDAVERGFRAVAMARTGDTAGAVAELRAIAPILERGPDGDAASSDASGAAVNRVRRVLIEEMVAVYADLAATGTAIAGFDPVNEAFRLADLARGMSVQGAIAQMSARAGARDPALEAAIRQEQDAARQIEAIRGVLSDSAGRPAEQRDARVDARLTQQAQALEADRKRINEDLARRFPDYEALRNPRPPSLADAARALKPDEALVSFFVGREASYVWALRQGQAPRFAAVPMGEAALAREVTALRAALDPQAASLDDVPAFDVARSYRLYQTLLRPVEAALAGARAVTMVPHGALGQLPMAVLVTKAPGSMAARPGQPFFAQYRDVAWLVRDTAISQVPSVAAFRVLRGLPAPSAQRRAFAGFGDPVFSAQQAATQAAQAASAIATRGLPLVRRSAPSAQASAASIGLGDLQPLPDTADEVMSVARALGADLTRDVFLGKNASEGNVKKIDLSGRRFVMFATHGLVPGELDGLTQPALALSAPSLADGDGDGLLTMEEILRLRLDADWVVLSACNTASGDGDGAEAVSGLGRAFFYAGARALLVTSWPVETTSARLLTTDVFARQARDPRLDRATALRQAMLALIGGTAEGGAFTYAHPIFWAPFLLVGDGG